MRILVIAIIALCPALVHAQAPDGTPTEEPAAPGPPPAQPVQPPPPAPPAQLAPPAPPSVAPESPHVRGTTFELGAGAAIITGGGDTQLIHGIGGLNFGIGRFVTPQIALTLRMAGVTGLDGGTAYIGTLGPHVQMWMGQAWVGAGLGLGFVAGCFEGCDAATLSTSYDLRAGVALTDDPSASAAPNLSVELVSIPIGNASATTISFLLGVQTF